MDYNTQQEKPEKLTRIGNDEFSETQLRPENPISNKTKTLSIVGDSIRLIRFRFADRILLMLIANRL